MTEFGYAGEILKVDLSKGITETLLTADYSDRFLGGRGIAAKIYWDIVPPQTKAFDEKNCLVFITGPVAGFTRLAGNRWQVCGKSPALEPESFSYANLGGGWGAWLKYAGYDGIVVHGQSDKPVYLFIHDGIVEINDASSIWGKSTFATHETLKADLGRGVRIAAIGPAGENMVSAANILADDGASGSGGLGCIMGSKMLKAIAVAGNRRPRAADPERLKKLADSIYQLTKGNWSNYSFPSIPRIPGLTKPRACYGCISCCERQEYEAENGKHFKYSCQAAGFYRGLALKYYGDGTDVALLATRLCDEYGLNTTTMETMIDWLSKCYHEGILRDNEMGMPISKIGSSEFIEAFTRKISMREGFGDNLATGITKAAELVGGRAKELLSSSAVTRAGEKTRYDLRIIITNMLLIATEPRIPQSQIHETLFPLFRWLQWQQRESSAFLSTETLRGIAEKFWGGVIAADFSTYRGKALAAKRIQDRACTKESLIFCDFMWPILFARYSENHVGDPTLESQVLSSVIGKEIDELALNKMGERIFNLQRAILMREGWGGIKGDKLMYYLYEIPEVCDFIDPECRIPGKGDMVISRKNAFIEREKFEKLKREYYKLRGWDEESGLQTVAKLKELNIGDVASDLNQYKLVS